MSIVVTTPTGNIGHRVAEKLIEAGVAVTLLARDPGKIPEAIRSRSRVLQGSTDDPEFVKTATEGAEALFWLTPPDPSAPDVGAYYRKFTDAAVGAIRANRIPHVVHLSSFGAQLGDAGLISRTGDAEKAIDAVSENVLHLRPGSFFENFLMQADSIRGAGVVAMPANGARPVPMVATRDIGDVSAENLLGRSWSGRRVLGVHGPEDLTYERAAAILGDSVGRPVKFVRLGEDQFRQFAPAIGASPDWTEQYLEMFRGLDRDGAWVEPRAAETTTPTRFGDWAREVLAPLIR